MPDWLYAPPPPQGRGRGGERRGKGSGAKKKFVPKKGITGRVVGAAVMKSRGKQVRGGGNGFGSGGVKIKETLTAVKKAKQRILLRRKPPQAKAVGRREGILPPSTTKAGAGEKAVAFLESAKGVEDKGVEVIRLQTKQPVTQERGPLSDESRGGKKRAPGGGKGRSPRNVDGIRGLARRR